MDEALEIPVLNDLTMVLGTIAQVPIGTIFIRETMIYLSCASCRVRVSLTAGRFCSFQTRATGVVVDFSEPSSVYDNVKQVRYLSNECTTNSMGMHPELQMQIQVGSSKPIQVVPQ